MEITISEKKELPLLKRTHIHARVFYQGVTPSRLEILDALSQQLKAKKELLIIDTIDTSFGDTVAHVTCRLYSDKQALERLERDNLQAKHVPAPQGEEA